jgi:hypothetical protein
LLHQEIEKERAESMTAAPAAKKAASGAAKKAAPAKTPAAVPEPTAAQPAAPTSPQAAGAKTKQQRLDDLSDQYKADKLTPAQYHAERAKILAEP